MTGFVPYTGYDPLDGLDERVTLSRTNPFADGQYPLPTCSGACGSHHGGEAAHYPRAASLLTFSSSFHAAEVGHD